MSKLEGWLIFILLGSLIIHVSDYLDIKARDEKIKICENIEDDYGIGRVIVIIPNKDSK